MGEHSELIDPPAIEDTRHTVTYAWGCYWAGRYDQLGEIGERDKPWEVGTGAALISTGGLSREPR